MDNNDDHWVRNNADNNNNADTTKRQGMWSTATKRQWFTNDFFTFSVDVNVCINVCIVLIATQRQRHRIGMQHSLHQHKHNVNVDADIHAQRPFRFGHGHLRFRPMWIKTKGRFTQREISSSHFHLLKIKGAGYFVTFTPDASFFTHD